ncbi:MAG: hypothetical protein IPP74_13840 [Alphaproteobacteria bacterium]|nr:hypothetical protein [Alphaproteobacteria bacterium]
MIKFRKKAFDEVKKIVQAVFQKARVNTGPHDSQITLVFNDLLYAKDAMEMLYTDFLVTDKDGNKKEYQEHDGQYTITLDEDDLLLLIGDPMVAEEIQFELRDKNRPRTIVPARTGTDINLVFDEKMIAENADKELYQKGIHARMDLQSPKIIRLDELTDFYIIRLNEKEVTKLTHNPDTFKEFMRMDLWKAGN